MDKDFVPYEPSLALKELGFNESCLGNFADDEKHTLFTNGNRPGKVDAPTFSQAFRWFREKYGLFYYITTHDSTDFEWYVYDKDQNEWEDDTTQNTYEEAELACLIKLIEIANEQQ